MKLSSLHVFIILLLSLAFCSCVCNLSYEGFHERNGGGNTRRGVEASGGDASSKKCNRSKSADGEPVDGDQVDGDQVEGDQVDGDQVDVMGLLKSMIPKGDEDLYILKSQIVPPVCPVCPSISTSCPPQKAQTPCPPCGRCPEPSFDCKKVPNYATANKNNVVPRAVLGDFSSFGM